MDVDVMGEISHRFERLEASLRAFGGTQAVELATIAVKAREYLETAGSEAAEQWVSRTVQLFIITAQRYIDVGLLIHFAILMSLLDSLSHRTSERRIGGILKECDLMLPIATRITADIRAEQTRPAE